MGIFAIFQNKRNNGVSYFSFFTEKLANYLGEKVTKEKSNGKCYYINYNLQGSIEKEINYET